MERRWFKSASRRARSRPGTLQSARLRGRDLLPRSVHRLHRRLFDHLPCLLDEGLNLVRVDQDEEDGQGDAEDRLIAGLEPAAGPRPRATTRC